MVLLLPGPNAQVESVRQHVEQCSRLGALCVFQAAVGQVQVEAQANGVLIDGLLVDQKIGPKLDHKLSAQPFQFEDSPVVFVKGLLRIVSARGQVA